MLTVDKGLCDECSTCISVCAANALMLTDELLIDHTRCTRCGACVKVCPIGALEIVGDAA